MILSSKLIVTWGHRNQKYYINKGYKFTKYEDNFEVDIKDVSLGSKAIINILCDYCNINIIPMQYNEYNKRKRESIIQKDCCVDCQILKTQESNIINYNVKNNGQRVTSIEKQRQTKKTKNAIIEQQFASKNYNLLSNIDAAGYSTLSFSCNKHKEYGVQTTSYRNFKRVKDSCTYCHYEYISSVLSDENNCRELSLYIRERLYDWKKESMLNSNYKCILTGKRFDDIHHLYGFNKIMFEVFRELNLPIYQNLNQYTQRQLYLIIQKTIELHKKYPLGVCVTREVHKLFHKEYGYSNNTPEQFYDFQKRYFDGEFKMVI